MSRLPERAGGAELAVTILDVGGSGARQAAVPGSCTGANRDRRMKRVVIYTKTVCPYCVAAKNLFTRLGAPYEEINLDGDPALREELVRKHRWRTVPMIFVGEEFLGGFDDVNELHRSGGLVPKLEG